MPGCSEPAFLKHVNGARVVWPGKKGHLRYLDQRSPVQCLMDESRANAPITIWLKQSYAKAHFGWGPIAQAGRKQSAPANDSSLDLNHQHEMAKTVRLNEGMGPSQVRLKAASTHPTSFAADGVNGRNQICLVASGEGTYHPSHSKSSAGPNHLSISSASRGCPR